MANDLEEQSEIQQKPKREGRIRLCFLVLENSLIKKEEDKN